MKRRYLDWKFKTYLKFKLKTVLIQDYIQMIGQKSSKQGRRKKYEEINKEVNRRIYKEINTNKQIESRTINKRILRSKINASKRLYLSVYFLIHFSLSFQMIPCRLR